MIQPQRATVTAEGDSTGEPVNKRSPTATDQAVGLKIRVLRRAAGMTLRDLGEAVGVSFVQFQRYETGASRMSASRLIAISEALCVGVDSLVAEPGSAETDGMSDRQNSESRELLRLFKAISNPRHRIAIIAHVGAIAAREEQNHALPAALPQNPSGTPKTTIRETE